MNNSAAKLIHFLVSTVPTEPRTICVPVTIIEAGPTAPIVVAVRAKAKKRAAKKGGK